MISINNLSKSYGSLKAVDNLNLTINKGEIFGLLGPNGAGKSTTIQILSSLQSFDNGEVFINNKCLKKNYADCKKIIGVVPQEISLYEDLSAYDNLLFWGGINGVSKSELKTRIDKILELIGLSNRKSDLIKTYSGGMKRRINIAAALLHNPQILFMDEPTTGVDPQSRNKIFDIIETLNKQGITIVYTTHYMEEVERLCNTIAIIDSGKIIAEGTKEELQKKCNLTETVLLEVQDISQEKIDQLQQLTNLQITSTAKKIMIECVSHKDLQIILNHCSELDISIKNIEIQKSNLESIFLQLTGKQLRD